MDGNERIIDERIRSMLEQATIVRLATVSPSGRPHVAPFWFACDGERIVVSTLLNQTVRNLLANPDAAVLVDLGTDFRDLRGALIHGTAHVYHAGDELPRQVRDALEAIDRGHADELQEPEFHRYDVWETREHVTVEIVPEGATWFDLGRAEMGRGGADARPLGPAPTAPRSTPRPA